MHSNWAAAAQAFIMRLNEELGPNATLEDRRRLLRAHAGEFHMGTSWGKKVWARESKKHLALHGWIDKSKPLPMDAAMKGRLTLAAREAEGDITFPFRSTLPTPER